MLDRLAFEERFQADVLLGDLTWETSYGLPGEGSPPRVRADITMDWPTWAQTAYRSWYIGEPFDEGPRIEIEIVLRIQRLVGPPDPEVILDRLPEQSPPIGRRGARAQRPHHRDDLRPGPQRARVRHRGVLRGQLRDRRGGAQGRRHPRHPLRRDGRLDRLHAGAASATSTSTSCPPPTTTTDGTRARRRVVQPAAPSDRHGRPPRRGGVRRRRRAESLDAWAGRRRPPETGSPCRTATTCRASTAPCRRGRPLGRPGGRGVAAATGRHGDAERRGVDPAPPTRPGHRARRGDGAPSASR